MYILTFLLLKCSWTIQNVPLYFRFLEKIVRGIQGNSDQKKNHVKLGNRLNDLVCFQNVDQYFYHTVVKGTERAEKLAKLSKHHPLSKRFRQVAPTQIVVK